jgi:hypothetical protein
MSSVQVVLLIFAFGAGFMLIDHLWWRREFRKINERIDAALREFRDE